MDIQGIIQDLTPPADLLHWQSEDFARPVSTEQSEVYKFKVGKILDNIELEIAGFTVRVEKALATLGKAKFPLTFDVDVTILDPVIEKLEAGAKDEAIRSRRLDRDFLAKAKVWKSSDPSMVFELQKARQRFCTLSELLIELFLSSAIQIRAFRSKLKPRRIAGSFDNSVDLAHFLEGAIGGR